MNLQTTGDVTFFRQLTSTYQIRKVDGTYTLLGSNEPVENLNPEDLLTDLYGIECPNGIVKLNATDVLLLANSVVSPTAQTFLETLSNFNTDPESGGDAKLIQARVNDCDIILNRGTVVTILSNLKGLN